MKITQQHTSVLIVGAGPSGLMMAAQLLRNGIQPVIIDSKQGPTPYSKALAVQARSLEIYRQLGILNGILPNGKKAQGVSLNQDGKRVAELSLRDMGGQLTPFPFLLMYQQSKNERLLLDYLTQNCLPVYWNTTLTSLSQKGDITEVLLSSDGEEIKLTCDWLIGADGARSPVRKELDIPFNGDTYQHQFYLADVTLEKADDGNVHLYLAAHGFAAFFLMPEENRYRVVGILPAELNGREDLTIDDIKPYLTEVVKVDLPVVACHWFTTYRLHHRMADRFKNGNCFLIGDAAHIHSPVGGQGMNTGLQDAYNLAWKLAGVVNGQFKLSILDSYAEERMPVAKDLLKTTDKAFTFILSERFWVRKLKTWFLPMILKWAWGSVKLRQKFFIKISQTGISYRESKLNLHLSRSAKIKAGDRLPYLKLYDEKKQTETDLHEWCAQPGFTFIAMGKITEMDLFSLAKWISQTYPNLLNFFYLPPSARNQHVFDAFEVMAPYQKTLIIRPDMHIGLINDGIDMEIIRKYMEDVVGVLKGKG
ncbi:FAD-dependent monooxygenase [Mucilaginibacter sp. HMF5004]|uniref:FAD-dependent monooxygenase n=1 Tax=Mucilaginibacter rivuli TaxID=2857527 RepID=UPI001C5EAE9A|nr:FAD-dependent monooxygenase [Mucilaginibacter rivuli]MBW4888138.1 FAD-dependent monooxygenase [Mucilaginibacter rivuli]